MWSEKKTTGFKFVERYHDPITGKTKKVSVTLEKGTAANRKLAMKMMDDKINSLLTVTDNSYLTVSELMDKIYRLSV